MRNGRTALLLGSSNVNFTADGPSTGQLLEDRLRELDPPSGWRVIIEVLPPRRTMAEQALEYVERHQPDVAVVSVPAQHFTYESVLIRIRRRWPRAYRAAETIERTLKRLARLSPSDDPSSASLVYRLPQRIGLALIGGETALSVEHAIDNVTACVEALTRIEGQAVIVRMPVGGASATPARRRRYAERLARFKTAMARVCDQRRVPWVDVAAEAERERHETGHGADGVHLDLRTRETEARILAPRVLAAAGSRSV